MVSVRLNLPFVHAEVWIFGNKAFQLKSEKSFLLYHKFASLAKNDGDHLRGLLELYTDFRRQGRHIVPTRAIGLDKTANQIGRDSILITKTLQGLSNSEVWCHKTWPNLSFQFRAFDSHGTTHKISFRSDWSSLPAIPIPSSQKTQHHGEILSLFDTTTAWDACSSSFAMAFTPSCSFSRHDWAPQGLVGHACSVQCEWPLSMDTSQGHDFASSPSSSSQGPCGSGCFGWQV